MAADDDINEGDIVEVRSGGPPMTVSTVDDYEGAKTAWCIWFDGKKREEATFPIKTLKKVAPDDGSSRSTGIKPRQF